MARDFHEQSARARDVFAEASEALSLDMAALCFHDDERLDRTEFTQPAILTAEIAMLRALEAEFGLSPRYFGGHSLGEYTALCAAGVLGLADAVRVTRRRGALMQAAVPEGEGAMVAVISEGIADRDLGAVLAGLEVDVANRNSTDQVVLSGRAPAVASASTRLEALLGESARLVSLNVSAPFHSRLMQPIEAEFRGVLASIELVSSRAPFVTSNFTGGFHEPSAEAVVDALTRQVSGTVDFIANMRALAVADYIYEIGPHRPLRAFFKSIGRDITSILSYKTAIKELGS
jgi:[acyl-carrier-protein] S-malonyltransferase/trans-AT polyketide synthase/acyltransferase/oxidoreductase domain-containing protein